MIRRLSGTFLTLALAACGPTSPPAERPAENVGESTAEASSVEPSHDPAELSAPGYRKVVLPFVEGAEPFRTAFGDINGDGTTDLAVCGTTLEQGFVRLYLGTPSGEFETRDLEVPKSPRDVLLVDLDADGHLDLATANNLPGTVTVLWGDGTGAFVERRELLLPHAPFAVRAADLDGDGRLDLAGVSEGGVVGVFWGRKPRHFLANTYFATQYGPSYVIPADLDADGDLDLVVSVWKANQVLVFPNEGKRTFESPRPVELATEGPFGLAVLDFDEDGKLDLVTPDLGGDPLEVSLSVGDGRFREGPRLPAGGGTRDVQVADLDADGRLDLLATATGEDRVFLYYRRPEGRVLVAAPLETGEAPRSTAAGDLNRDGLPDLVVTNLRSREVMLFLSEPTERIALTELPSALPGSEEALAVFAATESDYQRALVAFRSGAFETARSLLEGLADEGWKPFREGFLVPSQTSSSQGGFARFHASLLLLADIHRYHTGEPARARDIERELAESAEKLGYLRLAAIEWLAVGEIEERLLDNREGASAAYEGVLRMEERAKSEEDPGPPLFIADHARLALDRLHRDDPEYRKQLAAVAVPYPVDLDEGQVTVLILPQIKGYAGGPNPAEHQLAFARAHADSFRGSFADYGAVLLAFFFPTRFGPAIPNAVDFLERYPEELLGFQVEGALLTYYQKLKKDEPYQEELERTRERATRLGIVVSFADEA